MNAPASELKHDLKHELKYPRDVRFWIAVAVLLAASAAFAFIAGSVATTAPILKQDLQVSVWLHTHGSPVFSAFLLAITQMHSTLGIAVLTLIVVIYLWQHGDRYWVLSLLLTVPGGMLVNVIVKHIYHRARPTWDDPFLTLSSASFPSGHAAAATLFYGFLAVYMVWRMKKPLPRALAVLACTLMVAIVGFSRIYLGVHYLSDVLAAVSLGTAWLVLCIIFVRQIAKRRAAAA